MSTAIEPPKYPAGEFQAKQGYSESEKRQFATRLREAPAKIRQATEGLSTRQLDTKYKNWTVRQIVHHLADSHMNAYIRFKLALTEDVPTIKPYDETHWAEVIDAREGPIEPSLLILEGIHARWSDLVERIPRSDLEREFHHPELGRRLSLEEALSMYVWHGDHHLAQINWVREQRGI
jgi:hypothetical protein